MPREPDISTRPLRALPARPNLEHLRNEAKQRLKALRTEEPAAALLATGAKLDFVAAVNLKRYDLAEAMLRDDPGRLGPDGRDTIALHLATARRNADAVRWLIAHGVEVNAKREL